MIWRIVRSPECSADIRHAGYGTSEAVCMAVQAFAESGSGPLEPVGDDPDLFYLPARGGFALVRIDESTETIFVSRSLADNPPRRILPLLDDPISPEPSED